MLTRTQDTKGTWHYDKKREKERERDRMRLNGNAMQCNIKFIKPMLSPDAQSRCSIGYASKALKFKKQSRSPKEYESLQDENFFFYAMLCYAAKK